jgi:hypothetical protein
VRGGHLLAPVVTTDTTSPVARLGTVGCPSPVAGSLMIGGSLWMSQPSMRIAVDPGKGAGGCRSRGRREDAQAYRASTER